ncbi:DUF2271 domain-containing protein [Aquimonas sp.]|jgi:hypothetical protein|uniref:DUF2271 domain-containing protein n=1 Tax=Aquimonas sp. TaxID=1872588 RepID=UPI0037C16BD8
MTFSRAFALIAATLFSLHAQAASMDIEIEIPRLSVAEYHRPYVAVWIERGDATVAANLAVWYQLEDARKESGTKWLADLRQWWRRSGRTQQMPIDGVSGATRPPGTHALNLDQNTPALAGLAEGSYTLVVEAAREVGGRELLKLNFDWPPAASASQSAQGERELGRVELRLAP